MSNGAGSHYVICNWNERAFGVAIQLHSDHLRYHTEDIPITVITSRPIDTSLREGAYAKFFSNVNFHQGDPSDGNVLAAANVEKAISVTVLADDETSDEDLADARTLLTFLALARIRADTGAAFHCTLELLAEHNVARFGTLLPMAGGYTEVLSARKLEAHAFAQVLRTTGVGRVFFRLLSFTPDTCEVYRVAAPADLVGLTLSDANRVLRRLSDQRCVIVGLTAEGGQALEVNPGAGAPSSEPRRIGRGDDLLLVSYVVPSLDVALTAG